MTPELLIEIGIVPALSLLPERMDSVEAQAMLLAIALQESDCRFRLQKHGPARSYFQFEIAGLVGVFNHHASSAHVASVCHMLDIEPTVDAVYLAIAFHDVLASACARLNLWTDPTPLPKAHEVDLGWNHYLSVWRPGRPRPHDWPDNFARAWQAVRD